jgi:hypothetical protein
MSLFARNKNTPDDGPDAKEPTRMELREINLNHALLWALPSGLIFGFFFLVLGLFTAMSWWVVLLFYLIAVALFVVSAGLSAALFNMIAEKRNVGLEIWVNLPKPDTSSAEEESAPEQEPLEEVEEPEPEAPEKQGPHWSDVPYPDPDEELGTTVEEPVPPDAEDKIHWTEASFPDPDRLE